MSDLRELVNKTLAFVKEGLSGAEGGHDWFHTERVWKLAKHIRAKEGRGDLLTIELAALLHDISDPKFNKGDEELGSRIAYNFLSKEGLDPETLEHIQRIIRHVSFKGGIKQDKISSIEFQIVQDADRLDALGAIGIARAFNYGGFKNRPLYDPAVPETEYADAESYRNSKAPTINHFYEKLLKLKDLMNTRSGRELASARHEYMLGFLQTFYREWNPGSTQV